MNEPGFVIWSYEHDGWWRWGSWGYTRSLDEAAEFSAAEAERIVRLANRITVNEQAVPARDAAAFVAPPSIACPFCRRRSFNRHDITERYCGACHRFHEDL
jgi:hypothetical protein